MGETGMLMGLSMLKGMLRQNLQGTCSGTSPSAFLSAAHSITCHHVAAHTSHHCIQNDPSVPCATLPRGCSWTRQQAQPAPLASSCTRAKRAVSSVR